MKELFFPAIISAANYALCLTDLQYVCMIFLFETEIYAQKIHTFSWMFLCRAGFVRIADFDVKANAVGFVYYERNGLFCND